MTKKDMIGILAIIETAYPNTKRNEQQRIEAVNLWTSLFAEDDPKDVAQAVRFYLVNDATGFPPSIGAIKARMAQLRAPAIMGEVEAWGLVSKACRNGYYGAEEEFAKLPEQIQKVLGSPRQLRDWAMLDEDTLESVIASNFQRAFRARQKSDAEFAALPGASRLPLLEG